MSGLDRYLIICHISKINNVKQLISLAIAYRIVPVLVGLRSFRSDVEKHMRELDTPIELMCFDCLSDGKAFFKENDVPIIGIEIEEGAASVVDFIFSPRFAMMPGNEGTGLNAKQKAVCDQFVFIPQYGSGTSSLNVHVATSTVLHRAYLQQQAQQASTEQGKTREADK